MLKTKDWELVFSLNRDGVSVGTFFDRCREWKVTLLVIQDTKGYVFGGFCTEVWRVQKKFYGTGENFLYTFKDGNKPTVFVWTGAND